MITRCEVRRRWPSLASLAVLVAVVSGVLLTALTGAHRTSSTVDRFRDWARASDVVYQSSDPELATAMVAALEDDPDVEVAGVRTLVNAFLTDGSGTDIAVVTDPEGTLGTALDRPRLVAGRTPGPNAPDEVLLNELAARVTGLGVGDTFAAQTWSEQDLDDMFNQPDFPGFNGPELELRVVGIGRTPEELPGDARRGGLFAMGSPSFLSAHPGVGAWPPAIVVRLRDGADPDDVTEALGRELVDRGSITGDEVAFLAPTTAAEVYLDTAQRTVDSLTLGLLVFAAGASAAGALAVGPAVTRQIAGSSVSARSLEALGLPRTNTAVALTLPIVGAGTLGVLVGGALSVTASPLLPIGLARRAEVDPGVWVAPAILVGAGACLALGLAAWAFLVARRPVRSAPGSGSPAGRRVSVATRAVARSGASPAIVTGVHLASDRGRGTGAVPVRSAFVGVTLGVAGVLGAGVVVASLDGLTSDPSNWGWNWSTLPDYFGDGDISELEARLLTDDRVEAVADSVAGSVLVNGDGMTAYSMTPLKGSITFTRLDGRLPSGPSEVALGQQSLDDLGVSIGDTVEARAADGTPRELVVVGTVVLPPTDEYRLGVGSVFTPEGHTALEQGDPLSTLALRYPAGVDVEELERDLAADYGFTFSLFAQAHAPGSIRYLSEDRDIAVALGVFFAVIGAVGLLHALSVSTRRRRGDLAVLRSLWFRRAHVRWAIATEALALAAAGVVVGVPLGLIVGRVIWRALVDDLGVVSEPATPWVLLGATIGASVVVALLTSAWPASSSVRVRPAAQLRVE